MTKTIKLRASTEKLYRVKFFYGGTTPQYVDMTEQTLLLALNNPEWDVIYAKQYDAEKKVLDGRPSFR